MTKTLQAVYENGVLRPLEPLDLPEHQRVDLVLTPAAHVSPNSEPWLDTECLELYAGDADDSITLEAVRQALSKIPGSLTADFIAERDES
jgi:predicted DNA-binding antitoxin AbrB/MazE fold protein